MDLSAAYLELRSWLILHPSAILLGIFLVALIEAVAVVGIVVPAVPLIFVLCAIAAHAEVPLVPIFVAGIAGAMLGDGISYAMGKGFKHRVHTVWPFSRYPAWLQRSEAFVKQHGGKSIILGRFIGPLRAFVPMAAGVFRMRPLYFLWMNFLSALVWAPTHLLPGYGLGAAAAHSWLPGRPQLLLLGLILIVVAALSWALPVLEMRRVRRALEQPLPNAGLYRACTGLPEGQRASIRVALGALAGFLLVAIALPWLKALDQPLGLYLVGLRQASLDTLFVTVSLLGEKLGLLTFGAVLALWLALRRQWDLLGLVAVTALLGLLLPELFKHVFAVPRPAWVSLPPESWAFPSGHAFNAVLVWGLVLVILARLGNITVLGVARPLLLALMLFTIVSRPYLGVHWLSDVVAGALLGLACLGLLRWAWYQRPAPALPPGEAVAMLILALGISIGVAVLPHLTTALLDYQPVLLLPQ